ncbi:MAG TPA: winged helix-turn-helix domain-containing protein, partial [Steroidobacteraceae bacterium]|nr:winged helix-turn-helix domain-containing protein [Steroidobacteraceae bacterium]
SVKEGDGQRSTPALPETSFSFGPFRLLPRQHLLLQDDKPVSLGSRAFEILIALVEHAGELLDKDALEARAWPGLTVEESNLRAQITALRRVLAQGGTGESYVTTVPGRGYRFVAPVGRSAGEAVQQQVAHRRNNLPGRLTRPIGRAEVIAMVSNRLQRRRFITITGPAGIGKTTVALAVADKLMASYQDGAWFVDLAPVSDPSLVASALASLLGVGIRSEDPFPALTSFVRDKSMLFLFDTCEHVVQASAKLAEELLKAAPNVHILATSRVPLRAEDERVQRLSPLEIAPPSAALTAAEALAYPAVQLFVERASASADGYELTEADAPLVAQICRQLDGIALAIELAAGRLGAFGVRGVAARLDNRFQLLTQGRSTALPRHQTLRAALDWSYELLSEAERVVMRRLGVFAGQFTMEAANAVVGYGTIAASIVDECVANLVDKSLVTADVGAAVVYYRLSDTARAYALDKATESDEFPTLAERHARCQLLLFEAAKADYDLQATYDWLSTYVGQIDDLRSALDWAFSPSGNATVGIALTAAAVPLWFEMSLMQECRSRAEHALAVLDEGTGKDDKLRMQLYAAVAWAQMYTTGAVRDVRAAWIATLEIAEALDDTDYSLRALWGHLAACCNRGEFVDALSLAKRFCIVAESSADANDRLVGDRLMGEVSYFLGEQSTARRHLERMLSSYVTPTRRSEVRRFQFDQRMAARMRLAQVLWLQGFSDQALHGLKTSIEEVISLNHAPSLWNVLAQAACPVALRAGDLTAAERYTTMLLQQTIRDSGDIWRVYGGCYEGELLIRQGNLVAGLPRLRANVNQLRQDGFVRYLTAFLGVLAEALVASGDILQAITTIDEALVRSERSGEGWCKPELLRIKGMLSFQSNPALTIAEDLFVKSIELARTQGALAWELRTSINLAQLRRDQKRVSEAYGLLRSVYGRFGEGHGTSDLKAAKNLLDELSLLRR